MRRVLRVFRDHPFLAGGFAVALALAVMFSVRTVVFAVYWADPAHRDQAIAAWMTPRYVAHSWDVPPEVIRAALGEAAQPGRRITLGQIAELEGVPLSELAERVEAAIAAHREAGQ